MWYTKLLSVLWYNKENVEESGIRAIVYCERLLTTCTHYLPLSLSWAFFMSVVKLKYRNQTKK